VHSKKFHEKTNAFMQVITLFSIHALELVV